MNPTPAEILNGSPRRAKKYTPPTAASGMAEKIINASFAERNAMYNMAKISNSDSGTAIINRLLADCRFSNCPPYSR